MSNILRPVEARLCIISLFNDIKVYLVSKRKTARMFLFIVIKTSFMKTYEKDYRILTRAMSRSVAKVCSPTVNSKSCTLLNYCSSISESHEVKAQNRSSFVHH